MKKFEKLEYLTDQHWTPLWESYFPDAALFIPSATVEIDCIIPIPGQKCSLIFAEQTYWISHEPILKTIQQFATAHCYPEYPILTHCLRRLNRFGHYKLPWICPYFSLFPLENTEQTIWLNPLSIQSVFLYQSQLYLELLNGVTILLPISKRRIFERAEIASLLLATIARGNFHPMRPGIHPLDYLELPNTPFAAHLSKRPLLQTFTTSLGELQRHYQISYALFYFSELPKDTNFS